MNSSSSTSAIGFDFISDSQFTMLAASACASRPHATPTFIVATFSSVSRSAPLLPTVIFARYSRSTSDDNR